MSGGGRPNLGRLAPSETIKAGSSEDCVGASATWLCLNSRFELQNVSMKRRDHPGWIIGIVVAA